MPSGPEVFSMKRFLSTYSNYLIGSYTVFSIGNNFDHFVFQKNGSFHQDFIMY